MCIAKTLLLLYKYEGIGKNFQLSWGNKSLDKKQQYIYLDYQTLKKTMRGSTDIKIYVKCNLDVSKQNIPKNS